MRIPGGLLNWRSGSLTSSRRADYGIGDDQIPVMAAKATEDGEISVFRMLTKEDVATILRMSLKVSGS